MSGATADAAGGADERDDAWAAAVRGLLRAEMVRRKMSYAELVDALGRNGITGYNEHTLRNRVARGHFSAAFLIQCMVALGAESIPLDPKLYPG